MRRDARPLEGLIDLDAERKRLEKEIEKTEKYVVSTTKRLENKNFVERAPAEVVEAEREKVSAGEATIARLRDTLESIAS